MRLTGQRTFILSCATLGGAFILALLGKLTGDYATVASVACASYAGKSAWVTGKGGAPEAPAA